MKETAYSYKNLPIPGGGYVTGFLFHPEKENIYISGRISAAVIALTIMINGGIH